MNTTTFSPFSMPAGAPAAARSALSLLQRLSRGTLTVQLPDGSHRRFGDGSAPLASITLRNWNVCAAALRSGDVGFAESYLAGDWSTPSLPDLLALFIENRHHIEDVVYGNWAGRLYYRVRHWMRRNNRANSRKNIHAHYDLGNAFYALWLDETMNYSAGWFDGGAGQPLQQAQHAKMRRALRMAGVGGGARMVGGG
jgi:cyclopropane-fatty-acyl-phospholipid synthase